MRNVPIIEGQYYHVYNRGVDKRNIFNDADDLDRFFTSMIAFNTIKPIGSLFIESFRRRNKGNNDFSFRCLAPKKERLVDFLAFCLNPNHFHFIITPLREKGLSEFMKRLGGGYTNYFNEKYNRTGSLFQGTFKSQHIDRDAYLNHLSVYVNLNNRVHKWDNTPMNYTRSSWDEYLGKSEEKICDISLVMDNFETVEAYKNFAHESLKDIIRRKEEDKLIQKLLID